MFKKTSKKHSFIELYDFQVRIIPESKGCTLETFKGMPWIRRKRFDNTSSAPSRLPEYDIGSVKCSTTSNHCRRLWVNHKRQKKIFNKDCYLQLHVARRNQVDPLQLQYFLSTKRDVDSAHAQPFFLKQDVLSIVHFPKLRNRLQKKKKNRNYHANHQDTWQVVIPLPQGKNSGCHTE